MSTLLPKDYRKQLLQTKDCRLAVFSKPERPGYAKLFCLHGGPGLGATSLLPGILSLEEDFDLVIIDLRGESFSDAPSDGRYRLEDYVRDIMELKMSHYPSDVCGILGHSFGGFITISTLGHAENEFAFGILSNTAIDSSWEEASGRSVTSLPNAKEIEVLADSYERAPSDALFKELCLNYHPLYFPELTAERAKSVMVAWNYSSAPYFYAMKNVLPKMDLSANAAEIQVPCLIVGSSNDMIVPWECQKDLVEKISASTLAKVNGAGHFPFITKPNDFFKLVHDWWTKTKEVK